MKHIFRGSQMITNQVFLLLAITLCIFAILGGFVFQRAIEDAVDGVLEHEAVVISKQLGNLLLVPITEQDIYSIDYVIKSLKASDKNIRYIVLLDSEGRIITTSFLHGIPKNFLQINPVQTTPDVMQGGEKSDFTIAIPPLKVPDIKRKEWGKDAAIHEVHYESDEGCIYDVLYPLEGGTLGYIRLGVKSYSWEPIFTRRLLSIVSLLAVILLLTLFIMRKLVYNFHQPLRELSEATKELAQGHYDAKLPKPQGNELDDLVKSMQLMREQIKSKNSQINNLLSDLLHAQEQERLRLSRELHDEVGQVLASLAMSMGLAVRAVTDPTKREFLMNIREETTEALERIRRIAIDLRPPEFDALGVEDVFSQYIEKWAEKTNGRIAYIWECEIEGDPSPDYQVELNLFRIVQEGLTNVSKHAQATEVYLSLRQKEEGWTLVLADNGVGALRSLATREASYKGIGLTGMRERIQMLHGTIVFTERDEWRTWITVHIPNQKGDI